MLDDEDDVELGGVLLLGGDDALDDDSDDEGGMVLGLIDELDDVEPLGGVEGVVVDDDEDVEGDGVTTGGVLLVVDDDSRLQPATPTMTTAQSNATKALFISISHELKKWSLGAFSRFGAMHARASETFDNENVQRNQRCRRLATAIFERRMARTAHVRRAIFTAGR